MCLFPQFQYFWFCMYGFVTETHLLLTLSHGDRNPASNTDASGTSLLHLCHLHALPPRTRGAVTQVIGLKVNIIRVKRGRPFCREGRRAVSLPWALRAPWAPPRRTRTRCPRQEGVPAPHLWVRVGCGVLRVSFLWFQNIFLKKRYFSADPQIALVVWRLKLPLGQVPCNAAIP